MQSEQILKSRIFNVERLTYATASGQAMQRDIVRHPGSVAMVPILNNGQVCLIRNRRVSVGKTLIEIPAGTMEPPEPALACAHRELIEETGYHAATLKKLASFFPAPGILDEEMHLFLATDLTAGEPAREAGEQIENYVVDLDEAKKMVFNGEIRDAKTIVGILMLTQSDLKVKDAK